MRGRTRSTDVLARLAGDEFAVLLPNAERPRGRDARRGAHRAARRATRSSWVDRSRSASASRRSARTRSGDDRGCDRPPPTRRCTAPSSEGRRPDRRGRVGAEASRATAGTGRGPAAPSDRNARRARQGGARGGRAPALRPAGRRPSQRRGRPPRAARAHARRDRARSSRRRTSWAPRRRPGLCAEIDRWVVRRALAMLSQRFARAPASPGEPLGRDAGDERAADPTSRRAVDRAPRATAWRWLRDRRGPDPAATSSALSGARGPACRGRMPARPRRVQRAASARSSTSSACRSTRSRSTGRRARPASGRTDHARCARSSALRRARRRPPSRSSSSPSAVPLLRMHGVDMAQGFELGRAGAARR